MKELIKILIRALLLLVLAYGALFTFFRLEENQIGYVRDFRNDQIVEVFTGNYNFLWQGALPWIYGIVRIPVSGRADTNVMLPLPGLELSGQKSSYVGIPLDIRYSIDGANIPSVSLLGSEKKMADYIHQIASGASAIVFSDYLNKGYSRQLIVRNQDAIQEKLVELVSSRLESAGLDAVKVSFSGDLYLPAMELYREGVSQSRELRQQAFRNKKRALNLKTELAGEKDSDDIYFSRLKRVSALIKSNPDILKYIYIDKMGANIKVIISSDKTGVPSLFDVPEGKKESGRTGEIDNLR